MAVSKTPRLPSGRYVYRGRAVAFSALHPAQKHAWRSYWGHKGAVTRAREAARVIREIPVMETPAPQGEVKRAGGVWLAADAQPGFDVRQTVAAIDSYGRERIPKAGRGTWVAVVEWPDDPRSRRGKPYRTRISRSLRTFKGDARGKAAQSAGHYFQEMISHPEALGAPDLHPSRGLGRAVLVSVHVLTVPERPPAKRKRRKGSK